MDQAEGRRWAMIVGQVADAVEASRPSPVSREIIERTAVHVILADEINEIEDVLQQFAEAVKTEFISLHFFAPYKSTARRLRKSH